MEVCQGEQGDSGAVRAACIRQAGHCHVVAVALLLALGAQLASKAFLEKDWCESGGIDGLLTQRSREAE